MDSSGRRSTTGPAASGLSQSASRDSGFPPRRFMPEPSLSGAAAIGFRPGTGRTRTPGALGRCTNVLLLNIPNCLRWTMLFFH